MLKHFAIRTLTSYVVNFVRRNTNIQRVKILPYLFAKFQNHKKNNNQKLKLNIKKNFVYKDKSITCISKLSNNHHTKLPRKLELLKFISNNFGSRKGFHCNEQVLYTFFD